jgi:hypothetical protein
MKFLPTKKGFKQACNLNYSHIRRGMAVKQRGPEKMFKKMSVGRSYLNLLRLVTISVCLVLLSLDTAYAAAPSLLLAYRTDSSIVEGRSHYGGGGTRFSWVYLGINGGNAKSKGTLEIKDASYTFGTWETWNKSRGKKGTTVDKQSHTFDLPYINTILGGKSHTPAVNDEGVVFYGAAETGLSEKTVSWTIGKANRELTLPQIPSTSEQLTSHAPYIEYIVTDEKVSAIILKIVKPDDSGAPQSALSKEEGTGFKEFWKVNLFGLSPRWEHLQELNVDKKFKPGETIEVELKVNPPQTPRFIGVVEVWYKDEAQADGADVWQRWNFYKRISIN